MSPVDQFAKIELIRLMDGLVNGDLRALARSISLAENYPNAALDLLASLPALRTIPVLGITGPPGAGKSTLTDRLVEGMLEKGLRPAVLCIDPSSPFHRGALLGDRLRLSRWFNDPRLFIRSLASRGAWGGLNCQIVEILDLVALAPFDRIIVETVGVGQNEVQISQLASATLVVLGPEAGDEVQALKSGLLEVADLLVVNKSDRPGAETFTQQLRGGQQLSEHPVPVLQTVATEGTGTRELLEQAEVIMKASKPDFKRRRLLAEKAFLLLIQQRTQQLSVGGLELQLQGQWLDPSFQLYRWILNLATEKSSDSPDHFKNQGS